MCEGQRIETSYIKNTYNPTWNECFTFDIKRGDDPLKIAVYDRGTFDNSFVGKYMLNLDSLGTQQETQGWYDLHEENYDSGVTKGEIKLKVQWIYSRLGLMSDKVQELQIHQRKIDDIKRAHERELNMIKSPFLFLFKDAAMGAVEENEPEILLSIYEAHPKEKDASKVMDKTLEPMIKKFSFGEYFWQFFFVIAYILYFFLTISL